MPAFVPEILVVDDHEVVRTLLQEVLELEGYRVELAVDGWDALSRAQRRRPDAILLDVMMPELDGWQVLARLRADERTASVPVAVMSASSDPTYVRRARAAGSPFLLKPFSWPQVLALLDDMAGRRVPSAPARA